MNNILLELQYRIKGAKLYVSEQRERVYIPYSIDYLRQIKTNVFFEVVNDHLKLFVNIFSENHSVEWCRSEAEKIKKILSDQFYEIINDCELKRKKTSLDLRLKDDVSPILYNAAPHLKKAISFLCNMKVSALFADFSSERELIAIRLAQSRYKAHKISKLHIFLPLCMINKFQINLLSLWKNSPIPILYSGIESMSHNNRAYLKALEYTDSETMLIVDECHMMKSPHALRSIRIVEIAQRCSYKLIMTKSPIVNNIHDVYMQYKILSDRILGYSRWDEFSKMHVILGGIGGNQILGYKNLSYLVSMAEAYTYAIDTEETLQQTFLSTSTYVCYLNECQKYHYRRKKNELLSLINKNEIQIYDIFRILTEMQKIVCGYLREKDKKTEFLGTNKYILLDKHIGNGQCIIFCKFLFEVDILTKHLGQESCAVFSGKNKKQRQGEKGLFLKGQKQYFISTMGISKIDLDDLQECCHFIFFSISFKYLEYRQCIAYIKKKGIKNPILVERFITDSGIDRKIVENLARKGKLASEVQELFINKTKLKNFIRSL